MNQELKVLFNYVKAAINQTICHDEIVSPDRFFRVSRQQGLSGMIYLAMDISINSAVNNRFRDEFYRYTTVDAFQMEAIKNIKKAFSDNKIDHVFLKGAYLKQLYPSTIMRSMGDIDILIKKETLPLIENVMNTIGFIRIASSETHDIYNKGKVHVEIHPVIDRHFDLNHQNYFDGIWDRTILIDHHTYKMNDIDLGIYLLAHLAKHFKSSGVGIRQVLDIGIWENDVRKRIDIVNLKEKLTETGLLTFYITLSLLNQRWFDIYPLFEGNKLLTIDDSDMEKIETMILRSGVHGKAEGANSSLPRFVSEGSKDYKSKHIKIKVFLKTLFPSKDVLIYSYKYLIKFPWLLPFAWISRWLKWIFIQPKRSIRKLREYNTSDKEIDENIKLYKKIGL